MPDSLEKNRLITHHLQPIALPHNIANLGLCIGYLVLLRKTRGGTIGRRLTRTRLIDSTGQPPSWPSLARRFGLNVLYFIAAMIPYAVFAGNTRSDHRIISFLVALVAVGFAIHLVYSPCARSPHRQAFHDRWTGTWVVRASAEPAGPASMLERAVFLGSFPITYVELMPAHGSPDTTSENGVNKASLIL